VEKGETEGKSLLDAMRDGDTEGMQHFDGEIDKLIRSGVVDFEAGLAFASNAGNLKLELADFSESRVKRASLAAHSESTEIEIER
jgi:twitching motility protein PilT